MCELEQFDLFGNKIIIEDNTKENLYSKEQILQAAFDDFRRKGFPYPELNLFECMQEINELKKLKQSECIKTRIAYRVADTYNKHRFHSSALGKDNPYDSFYNDIKLKKVLNKQYDDSKSFKYGYLGFMSLVNNTQSCSNFRPGFARMIYNKYCVENGVVFDSSTGYGGRLVGFIASHCNTYYGTDPNTLTYNANIKLAQDLKNTKNVFLFNEPIEDLNISELENTIDLSFTSPPYFIKEIYSSEETQSCNRYPKYDDWINGFLKPMISKQYKVLKKDCYNLINIEDVNINGKKKELVKPSIEIAESLGFKHIENLVFPLATRIVHYKNGDRKLVKAEETVIVLKKI
jgi:hypothetical protein